MTSLVDTAATAPSSADAAAARADDLHRRYGRDVLDYCVRHLRSREEGEDAAQTVFLNVYRSLAKGTEPRLERAWLFTICEHVVSHRRRTNSRRLRFEVPVDSDDLAYLAVAPSVEDAPDLTGLVEALSEMPALQRRALLLREWRGLTYQEVANELGVSGTVVETLLSRGRHRLADRMQDLRRTGKRRALGLCLPWPSLQSLFGSGAAIKGIAAVASVALVTVALPLHGAVTRAPARPVAAARVVKAPAPRRPARALRPSTHLFAPVRARFHATHTRASSHRIAPSSSGRSPTIPAETPVSPAPVDTRSAPVADAAVYQSQPATDSTVAAGLPTADTPTGAPGQSQRGLESDPPGPPAQSNAGGHQNANTAADKGSSADQAPASAQ